MKIFSLESKTSLLVWSMAIVLLMPLFLYLFSFVSFKIQCANENATYYPELTACQAARMQPFPNQPGPNAAIGVIGDIYFRTEDYIFMIFTFFPTIIILSLIRHFRNKKPASS
jgi:hypothetical protein